MNSNKCNKKELGVVNRQTRQIEFNLHKRLVGLGLSKTMYEYSEKLVLEMDRSINHVPLGSVICFSLYQSIVQW